MRLGVNIDHIATIREARGTNYPDPVEAALLAESSGADGITCHIRVDRRHIKERDIKILREVVKTHLNVECSLDKEISKVRKTGLGLSCP
jgi:pyridoxine 5-phosphate synthase